MAYDEVVDKETSQFELMQCSQEEILWMQVEQLSEFMSQVNCIDHILILD